MIALDMAATQRQAARVEGIQRNGVKIFMAVGEWGLKKKACYVLTNKILAEGLGGG